MYQRSCASVATLIPMVLTAWLIGGAAGCKRTPGPSVDAGPDAPHRSQDGPRRDLAPDPVFPVGSPCGAPGGRCCPGNLCGSGGCCVSNQCVAAGTVCPGLDGAPMCSNGSCGACGGLDQPCCAPGNACTGVGTRCIGGLCAACGALGTDCCPQNACLLAGTTCSPAFSGTSLIGVCVACGEPGLRCCGGSCAGDACCAAGDRCVAPGAACGGRDGVCAGKRCACGDEGQPCCGGSTCNANRLGCDPVTRNCTALCGGPGQNCCRNNACNDFTMACAPDPAVPPGASIVRTCRPCGGPGQPCCNPTMANAAGCADGGCCVMNVCQAAGGPCQVPPLTYGTCEAGRCTGCGVPGTPCCVPGAIRGQAAPCNTEDMHCVVMLPPPPDAAPDGQPTPPPPDAAADAATDALPLPPPPPPSMCVPCGGPGQACCPLNRCAAGGCCARNAPEEHGVCVVEGEACSTGGLCVAGSCGACGKPGQRCCSGTCSAPFSTCRVVAGRGEMCLACGTRGTPCCFDQASGAICAQNLFCRSGQCLER